MAEKKSETKAKLFAVCCEKQANNDNTITKFHLQSQAGNKRQLHRRSWFYYVLYVRTVTAQLK